LKPDDDAYDKLACEAHDLIGDDYQEDEDDTISSFVKIVRVIKPAKVQNLTVFRNCLM
jgi:hypothetical protein